MRDLMSFRDFRHNPFRILDDVERDMRRIFDVMSTGLGSTALGSNMVGANFVPVCDVVDKDSHYLLSFDLPGVPKDEIKIEVHQGQLSISGERKVEKNNGDYTEKRYGRFERLVTLPQGIDEDKIEAQYENGVLNLALPKVEKARTKHVAIGESRQEGIWSRLLGNKKEAGKKTVEAVEVQK